LSYAVCILRVEIGAKVEAMSASDDEKFNAAIAHVKAGQRAAGETLCRQILAGNPRHDPSLNLLGVIVSEAGDMRAGIDMIRKAVAVAPANASYHCNLGLFLDRAGQSEEAIASYRKAIALNASYSEAWLNLGLALAKAGDRAGAIASYRCAIALRPRYPKALNCLGVALMADGDTDAAIANFHQSIEQQPEYADAWNNLGNALAERGRLDEAIAGYRRAVQIDPRFVAALNNVGLALARVGQTDEAVAMYRRAIELQAHRAQVHYNLGLALHDKSDDQAATESFERAIALQPAYPDAYNAMGISFRSLRRLDRAIDCFQIAVRQKADFADALYNLGTAMVENGQPTQAVDVYERVLALRPEHIEAINNLGNLLKDQGRISEALSLYRRALLLAPDYLAAHDNLIYTSIYDPASSPELPLEQGLEWDRRHGQPQMVTARLDTRDRDPDRRLRIGYVSPNFRDHSVSRFMLPLLEAHDRSAVELFCYGQVSNPDQVTAIIQQQAGVWRSIEKMTDDAAAEMIRNDRIDILVDLAGHSGDNRLPIFAQRPAPIQVSYLGYPATTGLRAMDFRLTDALSDPPGSDRFYSEKLIRLPRTMWCFQPPANSPQPVEPPVISTGQLTFGCFNNFAKVNGPLLDLWAKILQSTPDSRLVVKARGVESPRVQANVLDHLGAHSVTADRVRFIAWVPAAEHFSCYHDIDIALDTFPYNGTTTTCDALWMGVPVITLAGATHVSRVGLSLLSKVGLESLVTDNAEGYVKRAVDLAGDIPKLKAIRSGLREKFQASPMLDGPQLARDIEQAYRSMWHTYLREHNPT
jgi:protein O-GlcNAc transferase